MANSPCYTPVDSRREPLWDRVDRNRIELALFVATFVVVSVVVLDLIALAAGSVFGLVFMGLSESPVTGGELRAFAVNMSVIFALASLAWAIYTLSRSERWLVKRLGAEFVPKGREIATKMVLKDMAIAGGLPIAPALYRMERSSVNAFVSSAGRRRAVVGVTQGFIDKLTLDEQRAVFANLVARLVSGDTIAATGVASIVWPVYAWDERASQARNAELDALLVGDPKRASDEGSVFIMLFFGLPFAVLTALFEAWHRTKQRLVAEKADAEGMLLLKDPRSMLTALERCIDLDNSVPRAGEVFADLFYCWTGPSTNDFDDPEWQRVARLREVLGVEGA